MPFSSRRSSPHRSPLAGVAALMFCAVAACAGGEEPAASAAPPAPPAARPAPAGVVGHWVDTTMDGAALVVNGEQWSGQTTTAALAEASQSLFGRADSALLVAWAGPNAFPVAVASNPREFTSGTLRAEFNLLGGKSDQNAGILFGLQPNGEYLYVRYNTKDGNVALWRYAKGERTVIEHGAIHKQLPLGAWHELVVTITGRTIRGFIAGDTTLSVSHTLDAAPAGRVGLWVKRDAITAFRNYRVDATTR